MVTDTAIQEQVLDADKRRYDAMIGQDFDILAEILDDELIYSHSKGTMDDKASFLAALQSGKFRFKLSEREAMPVRVYGDVAILNGRVRLTVDVGGTEHVAHNAFVTVWVLRTGRWRLVHWQATAVQDV